MAASPEIPGDDKHDGGAEPRQQSGQRQIRVGVDERNMRTSYANGFRTNGTPEEVILDFGLNVAGPPGQKDQPEILFQVNDRIIMNYYSAKRLALTLTQLIRRHEDQFGELELDVNKRRQI